MPHAIRIHEAGGPENMKWEAVAFPHPAPVRRGCGRQLSA